MSKENLDNLFQQKANNRSFEFEEEYWNEMELLLEEEEDKKRFIFWWWNNNFLLGSLLAIVAVGLLYGLLNSGNFNQSQRLSENTHETTTQNQHKNSSQTETNSVVVENSSTTNSTDESSENTSNSNTNTLNNSNNTNHQSNNTPQTKINSSQRNNRDRGKQPNQLTTSDNTNQPQIPKDNPSSFENTQSKGADKTNLSEDSAPEGLALNHSTPDASGSGKEEQSTIDINEITNSLEFINLIDLVALIDTTAATLPDIPDHLKPTKEDNEKKIKEENPKYPVTLDVKIGLNRYWHNLDAQNATPYNLTGGIDCNIPIPLKDNDNLSLGLGLNYWSRGNLNASLTEDSTIYSFGFQTISTTKSVNKSYFLEVPVSLSYRLLEKHQLTLGASYSYLLTAQGSTSVTISNDFEVTPLQETTAFGFNNWLSSYDIAAQFGYKYFWNEKGYIGLEGKYGFQDLTPTTVYNNDIFDRNLQVRLLLGYNLFQLNSKKR